MGIQPPLDLKLRTNLGETIDKNFLVRDGLVKLVYKIAKSVIETSNQV